MACIWKALILTDDWETCPHQTLLWQIRPTCPLLGDILIFGCDTRMCLFYLYTWPCVCVCVCVGSGCGCGFLPAWAPSPGRLWRALLRELRLPLTARAWLSWQAESPQTQRGPLNCPTVWDWSVQFDSKAQEFFINPLYTEKLRVEKSTKKSHRPKVNQKPM